MQREYDAAIRGNLVDYGDTSVPPPSEDEDGYEDGYGEEEVAPLPEPEPMPPPNRSHGRRTSVSAEAFGAMAAQAVQGAAGGLGSEPPRARKRDMTPDVRAKVMTCMSTNLLFNQMGEAEKSRIVEQMFDVELSAGEDVIKQGDDADNFYVVDHGRLEVFIQGAPAPVFAYDNEGSFGELALMYNAPRAATVRAAGECMLWAMSRHTYTNVRRESQQAQRDEMQQFLQRVSLFEDLAGQDVAQLTDLCVREESQRSFAAGEAICSQGEVGDEFFILESGTAEATIAGVVDEHGRPKSVKSYQAGDFFGEKALMDESGDGIRAATITVTSASKCLVVPGEDFKALLGSLDDKLSRVQREYDAALRSNSPPPPVVQQALAPAPAWAQEFPAQVLAPAPAPVVVQPPALPPAPVRPQVTPVSAALVEMYEIGAVFKMLGARGGQQGAAEDAAFLFQLAQLHTQLVLRWSDLQTRKPVGFVALAKVHEIEFDSAKLLVSMAGAGGYAPIHLIASRAQDFQNFRLAMEHLHAKQRAASQQKEFAASQQKVMAMNDEVAIMEAELRAEEQAATAALQQQQRQEEYRGGNRVNQWGELTADEIMANKRRLEEEDAVKAGVKFVERQCEEAREAAVAEKAQQDAASARAAQQAAADARAAEQAAAHQVAAQQIATQQSAADARAAEQAAANARAAAAEEQEVANLRAEAAAARARTEAAAVARAEADRAQAEARAEAARTQAMQADAARLEAATNEAAMARAAQLEAAKVEVARADAAQLQAHYAKEQSAAAEMRAQMEAQRRALQEQKQDLERQRHAIAQEEEAAMVRVKAAADVHARAQLERQESDVLRQREALRLEKEELAAELRAAQEASIRMAQEASRMQYQPEPEPEPEPKHVYRSAADATIPEAVQLAWIRVIAAALEEGRSIHGVRCRDVQSFFTAADRDRNGWLDPGELHDAMSRLDMGLVSEQLQRLVHTIDTDYDGHITFLEFEKWVSQAEQNAQDVVDDHEAARERWRAERNATHQPQIDDAMSASTNSAPTSAPSSVQSEEDKEEQYSRHRMPPSEAVPRNRRPPQPQQAEPFNAPELTFSETSAEHDTDSTADASRVRHNAQRRGAVAPRSQAAIARIVGGFACGADGHDDTLGFEHVAVRPACSSCNHSSSYVLFAH